jgi:ribonuclease VapC
MALNIRNEAVNQLAKKLAVRKHLNKTEAVKLALENELRRIEKSQPLRERLRPLQNRVLTRPATGLEADKSFYDKSERTRLMFVDASAIVAILTGEPEADALADLLEAASAPITSPIALFEAGLGICRKRHASVEEAEEDVRNFSRSPKLSQFPSPLREAETALAAFSRSGKGLGHPAQLNLGDCFAYAAAKNHRRALLFKGDDFDKTDIRSATR